MKSLLLILLTAVAANAQTRPNIVFLYSDDHAAHAVSAYQKHLRYATALPATPNIDRIAREGMLFTNAFVTNSICGPARAAVLTGQYGHLSGVMTNADSLHPTVTTFPGIMRAGGYSTGTFGKWHLKERPSGFTHYEIMRGQGTYYNPVLVSESDSVRHTGYSQDVITDRALGWMKEQRKPFFAMISFNAPHRPWESGPENLHLYRDADLPEPSNLFDDGAGHVFRTSDPEMTIAQDLIDRDLKLVEPVDMNATQLEEWRKWYDPENAAFRSAGLAGDALVRWTYQRFIKDYMRAVAGIDAAVGRVLANLPPNTIVIYSSDQGFFLGDHGWFDKRWMYEESLRTPLVIRWPGVIKPGSVNSELVMNLDFAQTFLEIGGIRNRDQGMQGISMVPLLRGEKKRLRDAIYYQYFAYPDWHMVRRQVGVRDHRYKLIHYYEVDRWELFDLEKDPHEMRSVYDEAGYQDVVRTMKRKLGALRAQYRAPEQDPVPYTPWQAPPEYRRHH
jgi:arylsulfatase A-like enzyme